PVSAEPAPGQGSGGNPREPRGGCREGRGHLVSPGPWRPGWRGGPPAELGLHLSLAARRATSNAQVRETVALELSYVNSSLQLLKEELQELDGDADADQPESEGITVPMIPLGLKETSGAPVPPNQELISERFGEDGASYEAEVRELEDLRQATRTPSRSEAGLELLAAYYRQLCFLEARFASPARSLGPLFHWYDSLTGVPAQQRALAFEKGSVLFNIGALHTQIGARQDRSSPQGTSHAMEAFRRAAGVFSLLRGSFLHAPSPDMSPTWLSVLEQLMTAQAQECVFEGLSLRPPAAPHACLAQLHLAQEAAQVAAEYRLARQTMAQPPARDYVPFSWTTLVLAKAEYFRALAHYQAALALCDNGPREARRAVCDGSVPGRQGPPEAGHPGPGGGAAAARPVPGTAQGGPAAGPAGPGAAALAGQVLGARPRGRLLRGH
uniref:Rhophilin Rho GTPase binding protein 1 n=1 Tax=Catagonus wagneri TaxID=51154 RepID=A0A8C3WGC0_9CETA